MPSSRTREQIVLMALTRAGRGVELRTLGEDMLNSMLREWAQEYKYPILRKIGTPIVLQAGSQSVALPADYGAGMDSCQVTLGSQRPTPIYETQADEFFQKYGVPGAGAPVGRPGTYLVDQEGGNLLFNSTADQNYSITPIYFHIPDDLPIEDEDADDQKVWMPNDELVLQGLIAKVYQYNGDIREEKQVGYVESLKGAYRRGSVPPGGGNSRVLLSRKRFKNRS